MTRRDAVPTALRRIADVAAAEGHGSVAERLRGLAGEWTVPSGAAAARATAREVLLLLRPGSGQLADAYVRAPDGTPDGPATEQFAAAVELTRRSARRRARRLL